MHYFTKYLRDMTLLVRLSQYRQIPARVMNDATSTGGRRNSPCGQRHAFLSPDFVMSLMTHTPRGTFLGKNLANLSMGHPTPSDNSFRVHSIYLANGKRF
jgi:hypothetical protein